MQKKLLTVFLILTLLVVLSSLVTARPTIPVVPSKPSSNVYMPDYDLDGYGDYSKAKPFSYDPIWDGTPPRWIQPNFVSAFGNYVCTNCDCDDTTDDIYPGAVTDAQEQTMTPYGVDYNCDGVYYVETLCRLDEDLDGYGGNDIEFQKKAILKVDSITPLNSDDPWEACNKVDSFTDLTQTQCAAVDADWVTPTPGGFCAGTVDCSQYNDATCPDGTNTGNRRFMGCELRNTCEGTFFCNDIQDEDVCAAVPGCSYDVNNGCQASEQVTNVCSTVNNLAPSQRKTSCLALPGCAFDAITNNCIDATSGAETALSCSFFDTGNGCAADVPKDAFGVPLCYTPGNKQCVDAPKPYTAAQTSTLTSCDQLTSSSECGAAYAKGCEWVEENLCQGTIACSNYQADECPSGCYPAGGCVADGSSEYYCASAVKEIIDGPSSDIIDPLYPESSYRAIDQGRVNPSSMPGQYEYIEDVYLVQGFGFSMEYASASANALSNEPFDEIAWTYNGKKLFAWETTFDPSGDSEVTLLACSDFSTPTANNEYTYVTESKSVSAPGACISYTEECQYYVPAQRWDHKDNIWGKPWDEPDYFITTGSGFFVCPELDADSTRYGFISKTLQTVLGTYARNLDNSFAPLDLRYNNPTSDFVAACAPPGGEVELPVYNSAGQKTSGTEWVSICNALFGYTNYYPNRASNKQKLFTTYDPTACEDADFCKYSLAQSTCVGVGSVSCSAYDDDAITCLDTAGCSRAFSSKLCVPDKRYVPSIAVPHVDCDDDDSDVVFCNILCLADADGDGFYGKENYATSTSSRWARDPNAVCPAGAPNQYDEPPNPPSDVPSGWHGLLGSLYEPSNIGNVWDANDNHPYQNYLSCPDGYEYTWLHSRIPEGNPGASSEDISGFPDDAATSSYGTNTYSPGKYYATCCPTGTYQNHCLDYDVVVDGFDIAIDEANCLAPGEVWENAYEQKISTTKDVEIVCAPSALLDADNGATEYLGGAFVDADVSEAACNALNAGSSTEYAWIQPGFNHLRASSYAGDLSTHGTYAGPGTEYLGSLNTQEECCGDDVFEMIIKTDCDGNIVPEDQWICGNDFFIDPADYRISGNDLVRADECPDVVRSPPVYARQTGSTEIQLENWEYILSTGTPDEVGYCCQASRASETGYLDDRPFCADIFTDGTLGDGCFIYPDGVLQPEKTDFKEWCVQGGTDPYCVVHEDLFDETAVCIDETYCTSPLTPFSGAGSTEMYGQTLFGATAQTISYTGFSSTCDAFDEEDTFGCKSKTIDIYTRSANARFLCEDGGVNCRLADTAWTVTPRTIYYGPTCFIRDACQVSIDQTYYTFDESVIDDTSTSYLQDCSAYGPGCNSFEEFDMTTCQTEPECGAPATPKPTDGYYCLPGGNAGSYLEYDDGTVLLCDDVADAQNLGDYWCPTGFEYDAAVDFCVLEQQMCDAGVRGNPGSYDKGCFDLDGVKDDSLFGRYTPGCFEDNDVDNLYERSCCLDSVVTSTSSSNPGTFELYSMDNNDNYVKVY